VVSAVLLAVVLLAYRGGLAAVPAGLAPRVRPLTRRVSPLTAAIDDRLLRLTGWLKAWGHSLAGHAPERWRHLLAGGRRVPAFAFRAADLVGPSSNGHAEVGADGVADSTLFGERTAAAAAISGARRQDRPVLLAAEGVTVRFGGLTANEDVNLEVREGEIVGLIGPNGAGKTTCFNAIAGLNVPAEGRIEMFDGDVTKLAVHERARLGVGRTFQAIQLFGQLSVFENLLVATHQHNETGILSHLVVTPRSLVAERAARAKVDEVIGLLDLHDVSDRQVRDLPFGVLRMVEVARALVTGARLIMLDEPASGLDNSETDKLIELIRFIRSLGITILLIEHDVRMVTAVCDYIYVLERGRILAEGPAATVTRDERVIAAYLGQAVGDTEPAGDDLDIDVHPLEVPV
ncbi:MAG TPA: ABC transporter ATP-binding protein, partial [Acidimicrobiales bacterium]|nr:ABC transporter ATP-binding protein [Acidimicrobiales bacterium]